jgi:hypothetical protein
VCHSTGNISPSSVAIDGQSIRFDLNKTADGCSGNCWSDVFFFNRVIFGSGADNATSFMLDVYAALDDRALAASQALEFTIEQDVLTGPSQYSRFVYSLQCDYRGSGLWRYWDGNYMGFQGARWVPTSAQCVVPFNAFGYDHYVFNFSRPNLQEIEYLDFWINDTHIVLNATTGGVQTQSPWDEQLVGSMQLDSDANADSYSGFADLFTIVYQ